jgi:hypothetical protein
MDQYLKKKIPSQSEEEKFQFYFVHQKSLIAEDHLKVSKGSLFLLDFPVDYHLINLWNLNTRMDPNWD